MSIEKLRKELNWKPNVDLETGIAEIMLMNKSN